MCHFFELARVPEVFALSTCTNKWSWICSSMAISMCSFRYCARSLGGFPVKGRCWCGMHCTGVSYASGDNPPVPAKQPPGGVPASRAKKRKKKLRGAKAGRELSGVPATIGRSQSAPQRPDVLTFLYAAPLPPSDGASVALSRKRKRLSGSMKGHLASKVSAPSSKVRCAVL